VRGKVGLGAWRRCVPPVTLTETGAGVFGSIRGEVPPAKREKRGTDGRTIRWPRAGARRARRGPKSGPKCGPRMGITANVLDPRPVAATSPRERPELCSGSSVIASIFMRQPHIRAALRQRSAWPQLRLGG
jgi:hypothetical protein